MTQPAHPFSLTALLSPDARRLLTARGKDLIKQIGIDVVRGVVLDVLTGRNIRNSTEILTRRRIATLNLATFDLFMRGSQQVDNFIERLPYLASDLLTQRGVSRTERWFAQWILGLTDKGMQNILRDDRSLLADYRQSYIEACTDIVQEFGQQAGVLEGQITLGSDVSATLNRAFLIYFLNTIGAQTLTIRGSDKSTYGKLFEKLVLGSLLHILGFQHRAWDAVEPLENVFWLSSTEQAERESDATVLISAGRGIRFDIGFIGRGNTEISLDKVTRYRSEAQYGNRSWLMATYIIVDRIGERSRIVELADRINGTIIQMSASTWPQRVAQRLARQTGFEHPLVTMEQSEVDDYLRAKLQDVPFERFIDLAAEQ